MQKIRQELGKTGNSFPLKPSFQYSDHENDEFFIVSENNRQGIFKIWPKKVIDILEGERVSQNHLKRMVSLKKWLSFIASQDYKLQKYFSSLGQRANVSEYAAELFIQMEYAFSLLEPFYSIEAMVDNKNNVTASGEIDSGGEMDLISLMLPDIFGDIATSYHSWADIHSHVNSLRNSFNQDNNSLDGKKFTLLALIARKLGISMGECLFASKVLLSIHGRNEQNTLNPTVTIEILRKSYRRNSTLGSKESIDADINAQIRFMNWLPVKIHGSNFDGEYMNYDSVCSTSSKLFSLVSENPLLISEEKQQWFSLIKTQLLKLDASSARGRFLLQMLVDNQFSPEFTKVIEKTRARLSLCIDNFLNENTSEIIQISEHTNHSDLQQIGGKGQGIFLAQEIFGESMTVSTHCISWGFVYDWLLSIPDFTPHLQRLQNTQDLHEAMQIGRDIVSIIEHADITPEILSTLHELHKKNKGGIILRSSALTEDIEDVGSAPGVYESYRVGVDGVDISSAFKGVIASFFSDKAIAFRHGIQLCHTPLMAILIQPFMQGDHGSLYITESGMQLDISKSNINILDEATINTHFSLDCTEFKSDQEQQIFNIARKAFHIFGPVDIEFTVQDNKIYILQLRMLNHATNDDNVLNEEPDLSEYCISSVDELSKLSNPSSKKMHIRFNNSIDFNKFQASLSMNIIRLSDQIHRISLPIKIAPTSHLSNIIRTLGIQLQMPTK